MFGKNYWRQQIFTILLTVVVAFSLVGCGNRNITQTISEKISQIASPIQAANDISEVAPPPIIQTLSQTFAASQPQVSILSPSPDEVLQDNTVTARFQVQGLQLFKHPQLALGPHLHVILDGQPYIPVYDVNQPLVFQDLEPGTHTIRVFASRPWHESFKNEGAYSQVTFHIFTKTPDNDPDPALPLLTYSRPQGSYGAEPILLDFYLTNAPLHLAAQADPHDAIADWRVRCTINGNSFVLDSWQPIYLKGFKPGKNWVKLEFIDEQGSIVKNVFNSTVRLINYQPNGQDSLSKLVRGELSLAEARGIVDPEYTMENAPASPIIEPTPQPSEAKQPEAVTPSPEPIIEPTPQPSEAKQPEAVTPSPEPVKPEAPEPIKPEEQPVQLPTASPTPSLSPAIPEINKSATPAPVLPQSETSPESQPTPKFLERAKGKFFERFQRRPVNTPSPVPPLPEVEHPLPEIIEPETTPPQLQP